MKKTIKLAVVAALALGATSAFATNGDVMIGQGAKSRSMGGVGIAKSFGAESGLANPALLSSVKDSEVTGAVTFFMPSVAFGSNAGSNINNAMGANGSTGATTPPTAGSAIASIGTTNDTSLVNPGASSAAVMADSSANFSVIPEVAFANRLSDNLVYGLSMTGTAGMGTNYKDSATNGSFHMYTNLALLKIAAPVSYETGILGVTLGVAPILQYGALEMSHDTFSTPQVSPASSDTGFGFEFGGSIDGKEFGIEGLTLAGVYKSAIAMTYKDTIGASTTAFGVNGAITSGDNLEQPMEMGVGISYETAGNTIAIDYKHIAWGDAAGYSDFGWQNQKVLAVGYEYAGNGWAFRAGYNQGDNPIAEQNGAKTGSATSAPGGNYVGAVKNFFNLSGFPGVVDTHMTIGGGYAISDVLSIDTAFVYVPEVSLSYDTSGLTEGAIYNLLGGNTNPVDPNNAVPAAVSANSASSTADVTHSQMALNIAMTYKF